MRLISFALTTDQVLAQTKTQTRRIGWRFAKVGDRLRGVRKVQGRRKDEPLVDVAIVEITAVRRERLDAITPEDLAREGFPELTPAGFCELFPCEPSDEVTVIDFRYLDGEVTGRLADGTMQDGAASISEVRDAALWLDGVKRPKAGTLDAVRHLLIRLGIEVPRG